MTETPDLRTRKRAETLARIEAAAVKLTREHGFDHVTIDAIAAAADVSPRTFFNYFDSKEDAVMGLREVDLSDETIAAQLRVDEGGSTIEAVVRMLFAILNPSLRTASTHTSRIEVARRHPELLARQVGKFMAIADRLVSAVAALLERDPAFAGQSAAERTASAEMIVAICTGGARVVMNEWVASGSTDPEELETRAISLITSVIERIR